MQLSVEPEAEKQKQIDEILRSSHTFEGIFMMVLTSVRLFSILLITESVNEKH